MANVSGRAPKLVVSNADVTRAQKTPDMYYSDRIPSDANVAIRQLPNAGERSNTPGFEFHDDVFVLKNPEGALFTGQTRHLGAAGHPDRHGSMPAGTMGDVRIELDKNGITYVLKHALNVPVDRAEQKQVTKELEAGRAQVLRQLPNGGKVVLSSVNSLYVIENDGKDWTQLTFSAYPYELRARSSGLPHFRPASIEPRLTDEAQRFGSEP